MPKNAAIGMLIAALTLHAPHAFAAVPVTVPSNSTASDAPEAVAENWARTQSAVPLPNVVRQSVRETLIEDEEMAAIAAKGSHHPNRYRMFSEPERAKYERFGQQFNYAKVPGCFQRNALKHQPTFIFSGLLAIPFIPIAALRGKCN